MAQSPGTRVFNFYPLEDRILLSADGFEGHDDGSLPDADLALFESLTDRLANESLVESSFGQNSNATTAIADGQANDPQPSTARTEVIFVDAGVTGADQLLASLSENQTDDIHWIVHRLDADQDGVDQITAVLKQLSDVDAIHLLSHGDESGLQLGNARLDDQSVVGYAGQIAAWKSSLDGEADVLIYGCDLASSDSGKELIESIAALCDCDVAASTDPTGHESLLGDWELEHTVGEVQSEVAFSASAQAMWLGTLDTTTGLQAHYSFETSAGSNIQDDSGSGLDATSENGGGGSFAVVGDRAYDFSADLTDNAIIELPDHTAFDLGADDFSISTWFKTSTGQGTPLLLADGESGQGLRIAIQSTGSLQINVDGDLDDFGINSTDLPFDRWNHLAITRSGDTFTLYLNGSVDQVRTFAVGSLTNTSNTVLGAGSRTTKDYDGALDDLRFYDRGLSADDVGELFDLGVVDSAPTDVIVSQASDGGLSLNQLGNDTYYVSSNGLDSNLDAFTYEIRFNADAFHGDEVLLSYNVGTDDQLTFKVNEGGNELALDFAVGSAFRADSIDYEAALIDGQNHTLSVTWENTFGNWQVFIDGALVESGTGQHVGEQILADGTFIFGQEQDIEGGGFDASQHYKGQLYEARLFSDVRTAEEITSHYSGSVSDAEDGLIANWQFGSATADGLIIDDVGGMHLTQQKATGPGFTDDTPSIQLFVDESAADMSVVGQVQAFDPERESTINILLTDNADLIYSAATGKFYQYVDSPLAWHQAQNAAAAMSLQGVDGQLVTIRSASENQLVTNFASTQSADVWIGASAHSSAGEFRWVESGSESDLFWTGGQSGSPATDAYANVLSGQPDGGSTEKHMQLDYVSGKWSDEPTSTNSAFVVEWNADDVLDNAAPIEYQIVSQSISGAFEIDSDDGTIRVADSSLLDYDALSTHLVAVAATDAAGNTIQRSFSIELRAENTEQSLDVVGTLTANEGGVATITETELSASDPDESASELRYVITSAPADGQILLSGNLVSEGQTFTQQDILDGSVQYIHDGADESADALTVAVDDGQGAVSTGTLSINVILTNDPVLITVPSDVITDEDVPVQFGPNGAGVIDVYDEEGASVTIALSVSDAQLNFSPAAGLTVIDGDGTDGTLTFSGTETDLDAALESLLVTPDPGFNGALTLNLSADDGNTISLNSVAIVVEPVPSVLIWDGGGSSDDWSDAENWDLDRIPRADDTVIFNSLSASDSEIDAAFSGSVSIVLIENSYTGTIHQSTILSVEDDFELDGGVFETRGFDLDIQSDWTVTGGSMNIDGSEVSLGGNLDLRSTTLSSGSTVFLSGAADQDLFSNQALDNLHLNGGGNLNLFSDLEINGDLIVASTNINSGGHAFVIAGPEDHVIDSNGVDLNNVHFDTAGDVQLIGNLQISNNLSIANLEQISGGDLLASGDVTITDDSWSGSSNLRLVGTADQSVSAMGGTGSITSLVIDKPSGTVLWQDDFSVSGDIRLIDGDVDASGLDLVLNPSTFATIDAAIGPIQSLEIDSTSAISINGTLEVNEETQLTQVVLLNGGAIRALGDVTALDNTYSGTTILELGGSGNQSITTAGGTGMIRNLLINKSGGTATALEDLELAGNVISLAGVLDTESVTTRFVSINLSIDTSTQVFGDVEFSGFASATIAGTLSVGGDLSFGQVFTIDGGTIAVAGDVNSQDSTVLGSAGILFNGTGDQTISNADLPDGEIVIDKVSGRVLLADDLVLNGTSQGLTIARGELVLSGETVQASTVRVAGGQIGGHGTLDTDLQIESSGSIDLDADSGAPEGRDQLVISGSLQIDAGATLLLDVTGISTGGLISDLMLYSSRTGSFSDIQLSGNSNDFTPHAVFDDASGSMGVFLNTPPSGSIPDLFATEDDDNAVIDLAAVISDAEHLTSEFSYSLIANDSPELFESITFDALSGTMTLNFAQDQNGVANLTIRIADSYGDASEIPFTVTIDAVDDPPTISTGSVSVDENDTVTLNTSHLNSVDIDTDPGDLIYTVAQSPDHGTILLDGNSTTSFNHQQVIDGRVSYLHDGTEQFSDDFAVVLSDASTTLAQQSVSISVNPINDESVTIVSDGGADNTVLIREENSVIVTTVVGIDGDLPGDVLAYSIAGGEDASQFEINAGTGQLQFRSAADAENPTDANQDGTYQVTVAVDDGVFTDTQTINVIISDVNEFEVDSIVDVDPSVNEIPSTSAIGTIVGVTAFAIDEDASNNTITYSLANDDNGRFRIDPNTGVIRTAGRFNYASDGPSREIVVRATSADSSFAEQAFEINLNHDNRAPIARNDQFAAAAGRDFISSAPGLMLNDFDPDGNLLTAILVGGPDNGTVTLGANGRFRYVPAPGFVGTDSFQYVVFDGIEQSGIATASIQVSSTTGGTNGSTGLPVVTGSTSNGPGTTTNAPNTSPSPQEGLPIIRPINDPATDPHDGSEQRDAGSRDRLLGNERRSESSKDDSRDSSDSVATSHSRASYQGNLAPYGTPEQAGSHGKAPDAAAILQLVYEGLFVGELEEGLESQATSEELRQLERLLKLDLKQAILWDMWDDHDFNSDLTATTMLVGTAGAAAGLFSIGYVMWALRGGAFVSILASSLPAWRIIDPVAMLNAYRSTDSKTGEGLNDFVG